LDSPVILPTVDNRPTLVELEPLARTALARYGITTAELQNLRYYNNATYRVVAGDGRQFVLRVTCNHHGETRLRSEMQWLRAMQTEPGVRVPDPVAMLDHQFVVKVSVPSVSEPRWCNMFHWLDGMPIAEAQMNARDFGLMGSACAHLHQSSAAFDPSPGFERPQWDEEFCLDRGVNDTLDRIIAHLRGYLTNEAIDRFVLLAEQGRVLMSRLRLDTLSYGLIHADLHAGNCLFRHDGVAFIDFEDLSWGYFLYDVATALFGSIERSDYFDLIEAFTTAYTRIRPLPPDFAHQFVLFQVLRAVFLTHLAVTRQDPLENAWWEGYVVSKLRRLLHS